jgi:hypothetical protein
VQHFTTKDKMGITTLKDCAGRRCEDADERKDGKAPGMGE